MSKLTPAHMRALGGLLASESPDNVMKICRRVTREDHDLPKNKLNELNDMFAEAFPGQPIPGQQSGGANISKHIALGLLIATMVYHIIKRYFRAAGTAEEDDEAETADGKAEAVQLIHGHSIDFWVLPYLVRELIQIQAPRANYADIHKKIRRSHQKLYGLMLASLCLHKYENIKSLIDLGTLNYAIAEILFLYPLDNFDYQVYVKKGNATLKNIEDALKIDGDDNEKIKNKMETLDEFSRGEKRILFNAIHIYLSALSMSELLADNNSDSALSLHILYHKYDIKQNDVDPMMCRVWAWNLYRSKIAILTKDGKLLEQ